MGKLAYGIMGHLILMTTLVHGQLPHTGISTESGVLDGIYVQEHIPTKRVIPYSQLREADVIWSKRIWRTIDLKEKLNHPLYYPEEPVSDRMSLWDVIKYGALEEGSLTVYDLNGVDLDDQFRFPVKPTNGNLTDPTYLKKLKSMFSNEVVVQKLDENDEPMFDEDGNELYDTVMEEYVSTDIIRYELKEDWFFDKQKSVKDVRIIGISPVVYATNENGDILGTKNLFWLYFPECRYVFQNFFVYNRQNDARRISFDDLFWKRMFASYIHKETNVFDRTIDTYEDGVKALLESERIKKEMFQIEHDLWHL